MSVGPFRRLFLWTTIAPNRSFLTARMMRVAAWSGAIALAVGMFLLITHETIVEREGATTDRAVLLWISGLAAAALYLTIAIVAGTRLRRVSGKAILTAAAALLVALVGMSRVYLGVHYPSDVLAGVALGTAWALILAAVTALAAPKG